MSTITKEFTKEQLQQIIETDHVQCGDASSLARIALASIEAEPVAWRHFQETPTDGGYWILNDYKPNCSGVEPLFTAPPAPVSVPDESAVELLATDLMKRIDKITGERHSVATLSSLRVSIVEACRAAMLQGAERVTTANKLPAIGWLRADYQDDNRGLRGNAPLFVLGKKDPSTVWGLDYVPLTSNSPVIPDGWVMVPEEPTHEMLEAGDEQFGTYDVYRRMIAASPQQEVESQIRKGKTAAREEWELGARLTKHRFKP